MSGRAQLTYLVDPFDPSGVGGNSYTGGQIGNVWANWFGNAFSSLVWDSASDASNNPASGSMKITANFNGQGSIPNQFEVYDPNGFFPPVNGLQYNNFQCDVRFAQGSATVTNGGVPIYGHLEFGIATGSGQDYFGGVDVPASNTNWVHVSINLDATSDANLQSMSDVLIHIYGPYYGSPGLSGVSTLWVDNIRFTGAGAVSTNCVVDWNNVHQRIDGFGASSAWRGGWTTAQADMFFSTNNGIGLSLLRNHISFAVSASSNAIPSTSEISIMTNAQARGALVWSAPWTPAAGFKSTNDIYDTKRATGGGINGGSYKGNGNDLTNLNYASQLANYVYSMEHSPNNVSIYAISIQNEPDASVTNYEACQWSGQQIHDFVTNLYSALVAKGVGSTKIILPESQNWASNPGLFTPTLNDPNSAAMVSIVANHDYVPNNQVGDLTAPAQLSTSGKASWETEVSQIGGSFDGSISNGIYWAWRIHLYLTVAQANAWHYWWLIPLPSNTDNEGLTDTSGNPAKRMYALGQWSRFVRPGYYRIDAANAGSAFISAFHDTNSGNFAIVAVNPSASTAVNQKFSLTNFPSVSSVTPWITSATLSLSNQTPVAVSGSSFSYVLPAESVVTFVGRAVNLSNTAPTLTPVPNRTINAGMPLLVTNVAADTDLPPQSLTFGLLNGPANSTLTTLNPGNALFSWRPLVSQANTTNPVAVVVADNGSPGLSATNNFTVTVNPLTNPVVGPVTVAGGQVNVMVNGPQGPDYTLLTTTNLAGGWQALYTIGSTNSPVTQMTDTNAPDPARFYRIELGP